MEYSLSLAFFKTFLLFLFRSALLTFQRMYMRFSLPISFPDLGILFPCLGMEIPSPAHILPGKPPKRGGFPDSFFPFRPTDGVPALGTFFTSDSSVTPRNVEGQLFFFGFASPS